MKKIRKLIDLFEDVDLEDVDLYAAGERATKRFMDHEKETMDLIVALADDKVYPHYSIDSKYAYANVGDDAFDVIGNAVAQYPGERDAQIQMLIGQEIVTDNRMPQKELNESESLSRGSLYRRRYYGRY